MKLEVRGLKGERGKEVEASGILLNTCFLWERRNLSKVPSTYLL